MKSFIAGAIVASVLVVTGSGCGGNGDAPTRSYALTLQVDDSQDEYRYVAVDPVDIRVGDEVTFELDNTGIFVHDVQVVGPDGNMIAKAEPAAPGTETTVTVQFDEAGFYRLDCLVDDHLTAHGMQTFIEVTDPDA